MKKLMLCIFCIVCSYSYAQQPHMWTLVQNHNYGYETQKGGNIVWFRLLRITKTAALFALLPNGSNDSPVSNPDENMAGEVETVLIENVNGQRIATHKVFDREFCDCLPPWTDTLMDSDTIVVKKGSIIWAAWKDAMAHTM